MKKFFLARRNQFQMRSCMTIWLKKFKVKRQKNRIAAFTRNTMFRKKMSQLFTEWRDVAHLNFKSNCKTQTDIFHEELQEKMLNIFTSKVDALILYLAQL